MKKFNFFSASLRLGGSSSFAPLRLCGTFLLLALATAAQIPAPKDTLGFTPGDDRKLASWASIVDYFKKLDTASDRMIFEEIGKTTMGAPFVYATISSPENLKNLKKYKQINARLADPRMYRKYGGKLLTMLDVERGKTIVLITCGIHSTEVGSTLSSMLIAHRLTSSNEPEIEKILKNTIILLVPSLNPDGVDIVKNWYDKTLGTPYEGTEPPELYHKYVGHDNNRDWYAFTQVETQLTVDKIHNVWHPQIVHDIHQQGQTGSRLFLPPYMQPVEPNVPKQIVEGYTELGNWMAVDLRKKGLEGITTGTTYDAWTPARAYSHYHGGVRILSETASARLATAVNIKFENLRTDIAGGLNAKVESPNFGPVWKGGEWKLRNITDYMTSAAFSLLDHAADNRERWLARFYEIGKEAVRPRKTGEVAAYIIDYPDEGFNHLLESALSNAGLEVTQMEEFRYKGKTYGKGTPVIRVDQPYGAFATALLESQKYPDLLDPNGQPQAPYDVTAHNLALLTNTPIVKVLAPFKMPAPMDIMIGGGGMKTVSPMPADPPIRLYKSFQASMDEGWTRWIFEDSWSAKILIPESLWTDKITKRIGYKSIQNNEVRTGNFGKGGVIIFPDQSPNQILNGYAKGAMPDEYTGGVGKEGVENLKKFVEAGGTLVFLNRASNFAIEQFDLPVKDVTKGLNRKDFYIPGSILRTELDLTHPIAKGMSKESIAWFENGPVFEVVQSAGFSPSALSAPPAVAGGAAAEQEKAPPATAGGTDTANDPPAGYLVSPPGASPPAYAGGSDQIRIIARYPSDPKQILLSGWALGAERIAGKAALVEFTIGKGKIILFGFRPQYRGQSLATFPLLFNAISQ